jgi:uncharacterized protein
LRALEAGTLPGQFTYLFGELRHDGTPIGIVPAFVFDVPLALVIPPALARIVLPVAKGPLRGLAHQRTFFIGNVAGEEGHVGLVAGWRLAQVAAFIHASACAKADELRAPMRVWKDFPDCDREALDAMAKATRIFRIVSYPGTTIPIVRPNYEAFLGTLRAEARRRIRLKLKRGSETLALESQVIARPDERDLDAFYALFRQTYERATTRFEELTPQFFRTIALADEATFVVLRDPGRGPFRAFMLMLDLGDRAINQFIGIDHACADGAWLYFRLFAAAYDWACTTQATTLQSGQTGYRVKFDMGHALVPLWNWCEHRGAIVNPVFRRAAAGIAWDTLDPQLAEYLRAHPQIGPPPSRG